MSDKYSRKSNRVQRTRSSFDRKPKRLLPTLIVFGFVLVLSVVTAGVWQFMDKTPYIEPKAPQKLDTEVKNEQNKENKDKNAEVKDESKKNEPVLTDGEINLKDVNKNENTESKEEEKPSSQYGLVPKGEWKTNKYFDDAVFMGDSITDGIKLYDLMSNATVLSHTGINLNNIMTKEVVGKGEDKKTIPDALGDLSVSKIYILMGANSMGLTKDAFISSYKILINKVRELQPDATIYVQSILPVTKEYEERRPMFSNTKIDEYNEAILEMCEEMEIYYINIAEAFKDEEGRLPTEASPNDGMHFGGSWYTKWFNYLHEHAI